MSDAQEREAVALQARVLAGATATVGRRRGSAGGTGSGMGGALDGAGRQRRSRRMARVRKGSGRATRPEIGRRS